MKIVGKLKASLAGVIAGTMLFSSATVMPSVKELDAEAAGTCTINTNKL